MSDPKTKSPPPYQLLIAFDSTRLRGAAGRHELGRTPPGRDTADDAADRGERHGLGGAGVERGWSGTMTSGDVLQHAILQCR